MIRGLLACLLLGAVSALQAAVPEIPRFRLVTAADGLPATSIPALVRDREGYLWAGTWDGLARYDGIGFKVWRHDPADPASLPGNVVQAVHVDARDRVWVATENGGLSMLDTDRKTLRHYRKAEHPQMGSDDVFAIASRGDEIWFGTYGGGLHRLDADGRITAFRASDDPTAGLPDDTVLSLAVDVHGQLWIGTLAGLARMEGDRVRYVDLPIGPGHIIYSLTPDGEQLWVGTSSGMYRREADGTWTTPTWSPMFARPNAVLSLVNGGDGQYWMGSQSGLWRTAGDRAPAPVVTESLGRGVGRVLEGMLRQPDGGVWVALPALGLGYLRADWRRIAALSTAQGLQGGVYRGLAQADDGGLWVGASLGNIEHVDLRTGEVAPLPWEIDALKQMRVMSLLQDRRGVLWAGINGGLIRIDPSTGASKVWKPGSGPDDTPNSSIDWLLQAPDGSLWLSTQSYGLQQRDGVTGQVLERILPGDGRGLDQADTDVLEVGPDGQPWLGGGQGLLHWDPVGKRLVPVPDVGSGRVYSMAFESPQQLWLHRLSGLERWVLQNGRWTLQQRIDAGHGLPAVESNRLQRDAHGRLWLATRRGLFRAEAATATTPPRVRAFGVRDGLLNQEFNDRALLMTRGGVLAGSAADGSLMLLDTDMPDLPPVVPRLVLESIQVSGRGGEVALPLRGGFTLGPDDHELVVSTRLLSYDDPSANRYRSRLDGFDRDWIPQGPSGERAFSALAPGHYALHLQGIDAMGNTSNEQLLTFTVAPPWWRSRWGIAGFICAGLLIALALAAAYRQRLQRRSQWQLAVHKRELAEQASLAKTRFLATLGHEVRTPMTGVLGMSELLLDTPLDDRQRGYANAIQGAGKHLLRLVNDALDLARIEAGKLLLDQQDFDLPLLLDEVVALVRPMAEKKSLQFSYQRHAYLPRLLRGDPIRVRQILLNLLLNAVKFTERGSVTLEALPLHGGGVRLVVGDTGPGISPEQRERLFQRFEQADGARTAARYGGSGLGLAICQELALAMGGRIDVDSVPSMGTRFRVELPLPPGVEPLSLPEPAPAAALTASLRVLLVEDDATVAEVIGGLLRARGHQVEHVAHGLAALTAMALGRYDIGLLDLDLPGLDGVALARQMRVQGFTAPLLAVTARADADAEPMAFDAGFDGFLRKPVTGDLLAAAIADVMELALASMPALAGAGRPPGGAQSAQASA